MAVDISQSSHAHNDHSTFLQRNMAKLQVEINLLLDTNDCLAGTQEVFTVRGADCKVLTWKPMPNLT